MSCTLPNILRPSQHAEVFPSPAQLLAVNLVTPCLTCAPLLHQQSAESIAQLPLIYTPCSLSLHLKVPPLYYPLLLLVTITPLCRSSVESQLCLLCCNNPSTLQTLFRSFNEVASWKKHISNKVALIQLMYRWY